MLASERPPSDLGHTMRHGREDIVAEKAAKLTLDYLVDMVCMVTPDFPTNHAKRTDIPKAKSKISQATSKRKATSAPADSTPKRQSTESTSHQLISSLPCIPKTLALRLTTYCYICAKQIIKFQAVHNGQIIYLCSSFCRSEFTKLRAVHGKTNCVQCLKRVEISSLAFRPTFGLLDSVCCSELCFLRYNNSKAPTFLCRLQECKKPVENVSYRWQAMEFCKLDCLSTVFRKTAKKCSQCQRDITSSHIGSYSQRFGTSIRNFCSRQCRKSFESRNKRRCESCNILLTIAPSSGHCSFRCENTSTLKKMVLSIIREHDQQGDFCDICKRFVHLEDLNEKFHNYRFIFTSPDAYIFVCSPLCTAAYRQQHRIAKNMCNVCNSSNWEGCGVYCRSGNEILPFCSRQCLSIYIYSTKTVSPCDLCGRPKAIFKSIQCYKTSDGYFNNYCSLNCSQLHSDSDQLTRQYSQRLLVIKCAYCRGVSKSGIHMRDPKSKKILSFCSYVCSVYGESPPINLPKIEIKRVIAPPPVAKRITAPAPKNMTPLEKSCPTLSDMLSTPVPTSVYGPTVLNGAKSNEQSAIQVTQYSFIPPRAPPSVTSSVTSLAATRPTTGFRVILQSPATQNGQPVQSGGNPTPNTIINATQQRIINNVTINPTTQQNGLPTQLLHLINNAVANRPLANSTLTNGNVSPQRIINALCDQSGTPMRFAILPTATVTQTNQSNSSITISPQSITTTSPLTTPPRPSAPAGNVTIISPTVKPPPPELILLTEATKKKSMSNAQIQAAPTMISKAVMCKPREETQTKPAMISVEIQTNISWVDDDLFTESR